MSEAIAPAAPPAFQTAVESVFRRQQQYQYVMARTSARERIARLWRLHAAMLRYRDEVKAAMWADFRKSAEEVDISEISIINSEIRHTIQHLQSWMTPRRVPTRLPLLGASSKIRYEPKGVCLIIGPWNFPFNLNFTPLVAAIAAGNCVVIKPSEHVPHSSALIRKIVEDCFPPEEVAVFEGEIDVAQALLALPFNHIFFTGSTAVGKIVMQAAAKHLASVTLELGGKSPVIVDESANLDLAASRIVWLKCMNAGQSCIAPDYVLVQESVYDVLIQKMKTYVERFYGATLDARRSSPDLCRAVHDRHFANVKGLLDDAIARGGKAAFGGFTDAADRYIDPTVLVNTPMDAAIWEHEIFGLLTLVAPYRTLDDALAVINAKPKSLALYIFSSRNRTIERLIAETRNGGVCVNECGLQFFNPDLPFGGHNDSGIGKYHGESGFLEFSNQRSVARQHNTIYPTTNVFLPPYGSWLMRKVLNGLARWL